MSRGEEGGEVDSRLNYDSRAFEFLRELGFWINGVFIMIPSGKILQPDSW